ncbi:MAG TPA: DUF4397 domain-containing protein [Gemmatimonadaceae bacterium]|jgi:hypothetical protein|nr:DUF4397 domain-containing protein [Gemmatimonadaceae bacterium]
MRFRTLSAALLVSAVVLAACDSDNSTGIGDTSNKATVQFINASNTSLDVATNGAVATGNGALNYSTAGSCMSVDASNSGLAVRTTGTSTALAGFTPAFTAGGNYTVIAYPGTAGATQFVTLSNAFTPATGQAGLRVVNVGLAGSNYDVYVAAPGAALGTANANNLGVGTGSSYFNVSATSAQHIAVTNAGTQTVLLDFGNSNTFTAGKRTTLVISTLPTNTTQPSGFFVTGC